MKSKAMVRGTLDVVLMVVLTAGMAAGTGCGSSGNSGGSGGGGGGVTTPNGAQNIFVVEGSTDGISSILQFKAGEKGAALPTATLNPPNGFFALSVATDSTGQVYVGGYSGSNLEILVYAAGATGPAAPLRMITTSTFAQTNPIIPSSMVVDAAGNLYVASEPGAVVNQGGNVAVYSPTANGVSTPTRQLTSSLLTDPVGVAVDGAGNIYVSNLVPTATLQTGAIYVFGAGSNGSAAPTRTITTPNIFYGIAVDASGNLYANELTETPNSTGAIQTVTSQIDTFSATATGAATPTKSIQLTNANEPVVFAAGLRVDGAGNLFAAVQTASGTTEGATVVTDLLEYGPNATGNAAPITDFSSSSWLYPGEEIAVD